MLVLQSIKSRLLFFSIIILCGNIFSACDLINPAEEQPAFIYVPEVILETEPARQGSSSANITEVWLDVDGVFLGAYALPAMIPILKNGLVEISLQAGIKDNGISATPEIYPFYAPFVQDVELKPEGVDTIRPRITYREDIRFAFIEDFESAPHLFQDLRRGDESNRIIRSQENVFEGNYSGKLSLTETFSFAEIATSRSFSDLSTKGVFVYLEMDYRSETPVVFGIVGRNRSDPDNEIFVFDPGFAPKETWNKIYFNLSLLVLDNPFEEYQISLQTFLSAQDGGADNATVCLDNIKLIHF